jgi:putative molybdopterin biosynthesis protein
VAYSEHIVAAATIASIMLRIAMAVRTNLGPLRKGRGFGATELARIAGISRQTLHAIEAGAYVPNTAVALRLAQTLGVGVEAIFALEEQKSENGVVSGRLLEPGQVVTNAPVQLVAVGENTVAVPAVRSEYFIGPYDAVVKSARGGQAATFERVGEAEAQSTRLLLAGCDPAAAVLVNEMRPAGVELVPWHANSAKALELLRESSIHIAGCHFGRDASETAIRPMFGGDFVVMTLTTWEEGLVVVAGNPKSIRGVEDLVRPDVVIINREAGAGSRRILDEELKRAGIGPERVQGYARTAPAHLAAAREVAEGRSDCCIAPSIAARALGLGFVPLLSERYDLVVRRELMTLGLMQAFLNSLTSAALRRKLAVVGGYDMSAMGRVVG